MGIRELYVDYKSKIEYAKKKRNISYDLIRWKNLLYTMGLKSSKRPIVINDSKTIIKILNIVGEDTLETQIYIPYMTLESFTGANYTTMGYTELQGHSNYAIKPISLTLDATLDEHFFLPFWHLTLRVMPFTPTGLDPMNHTESLSKQLETKQLLSEPIQFIRIFPKASIWNTHYASFIKDNKKYEKLKHNKTSNVANIELDVTSDEYFVKKFEKEKIEIRQELESI